MRFETRLALSSALLASLLCVSARASDYEVGASLACDTQAQVERFVALFTDDAQAAIQAVNAEEQNPSACVIRNVAYMRGRKVGMTRHGDRAFEIVRILVVGMKTVRGLVPVRPSISRCSVSRNTRFEIRRPAADDRLRMWPVSRRVNKTGNGDYDPTLLDEVAAR